MKTAVKVSPKVAGFKSMLNSNSLKATPARLAVLKVLDSTSTPLSITDIQNKLKSKAPDTATLYRMMQQLLDQKIVSTVDFKHNHAHYELTNKKHHHHIICTNCNTVVDLEQCYIDEINKKAKKKSGFPTISQHTLELYGLCAKCNN